LLQNQTQLLPNGKNATARARSRHQPSQTRKKIACRILTKNPRSRRPVIKVALGVVFFSENGRANFCVRFRPENKAAVFTWPKDLRYLLLHGAAKELKSCA